MTLERGPRQPIARRRHPVAPLRPQELDLRRTIARLHAEHDTLTRFIDEANRADDLATGLTILAEAARAALGAAGAALYLYESRERTIDAAFVGYREEAIARARALEHGPGQFPNERTILATDEPIVAIPTPGEVTRPTPDARETHWHTLILPLRYAKKTVGSLQLSRPATGPSYTASTISVGRDLAAIAGLIVGRLQQEALVRQRAARAEALREIGRQLSSELDFERFLDNAAAHLTALLDVRDCLLLTWDEEARELTPELYIGGGERQSWRVTIRPDEQRGLTGIVVNERRTIVTADYLAECRRHAIEPVLPPGDWAALAWVGMPLLARGRLIGVLVVERHRQPFTEEEVILLESLGGQLAAAMEHARLYAEVRKLATTDPLTGLANHRHIHERLHQELERAMRHERPLAVAMLDLDQFKHYNDTCGHQAGDDLLRAVAATLRAELRASDLAGRYGGDEFLLLLPETTTAEANHLLARILTRLPTLTILALAHGCPVVTASVGVASYPESATTAHALIARADTALYDNKRIARATQRVDQLR